MALAWVMLAVGFVLGGVLGYAVGVWRGRKGADDALIEASESDEEAATKLADDEKAKITSDAEALKAKVRSESAEQAMHDLESMK